MRWAINFPTVVTFAIAVVVLLVVYHFLFHVRKTQ